ncbi:hypothetical protein LOTGIDRAFT_239635 [Lottia gigantea]|uniref:Uncharacterized protein n=1 Tax=Lottia gigantea TaxID=225164 RepID=V3ZU55_LOTGI|nr:hypothetical protein LOTGIDRAFT_239635 [Lottia gigantea]ESO86120.1 hypothetical protein LOTGIDRAFT_239635 [Lottia gigantea]
MFYTIFLDFFMRLVKKKFDFISSVYISKRLENKMLCKISVKITINIAKC